MIDQLIIGDKASYDDFMASMAKRKIKLPKKKSIKETVPFSNKTYDFSNINGEVYWEESELEYTFEIMADDPEELEELKSKFSSWLRNIQEEEIHDPFIPNYHFIGTYEDMDYEDEEDVEKTTATVTFKAYPYMIANVPKVYQITLKAGIVTPFSMINESSHPIGLTVKTDAEISIAQGYSTYVISAGEYKLDTFRLPIGNTAITIGNVGENPATVTISFCEEVS